MSWHHQVSGCQEEMHCEFIFQNMLLNNMYVIIAPCPPPHAVFLLFSGLKDKIKSYSVIDIVGL
jgi:hypothetical protein